MKQTIINIYVLVTAGISLLTTFLQKKPALYIIEWLAPKPGDEFNIAFVFIFTFLLFLLPLFIVVLFLKLFTTEESDEIDYNKTGIVVNRQKSFQSAMVNFPIYINERKVGMLANGKTRFFEVTPGIHTLQVGEGKQASEKIEVNIQQKEHKNFTCYISSSDWYAKVMLSEVKDG